MDWPITGFTDNIPKRNINTAHDLYPNPSSPIMGDLFVYFLPQPLSIKGILANQKLRYPMRITVRHGSLENRLHYGRVRVNFTDSNNSLIRMDLNNHSILRTIRYILFLR